MWKITAISYLGWVMFITAIFGPPMVFYFTSFGYFALVTTVYMRTKSREERQVYGAIMVLSLWITILRILWSAFCG